MSSKSVHTLGTLRFAQPTAYYDNARVSRVSVFQSLLHQGVVRTRLIWATCCMLRFQSLLYQGVVRTAEAGEANHLHHVSIPSLSGRRSNVGEGDDAQWVAFQSLLYQGVVRTLFCALPSQTDTFQSLLYRFVTQMYARFLVEAGQPCSDRDFG